MKVLVTFLAALTAAAECSSLFQTYGLPPPPPPPHPPPYNGVGISCPDWQIFHNGRCVAAEVTKNVYVFNVPHVPKPPGIRPPTPPPKVEHNVVFVRLPEEFGDEDPIVVPPPQQKNIVYVLKKDSDHGVTDVIHVPAPPKSSPEVYFVNVGQGENPLLPTGEDLQSALSKGGAEFTAQVVGERDSFGHDIIIDNGHQEIHTNYGPPDIITNYGPPDITTNYGPPDITTNYGPPVNPPSVVYSSP